MNKKLRNHLGSDWYSILSEVFKQDGVRALQKFVNERRNGFNSYVYPAKEDVFKAFRLCPFSDVRVVILGQEPYNAPNVANGLAFSSMDTMLAPPSLQTLFLEIENTMYDGLKLSQSPDLTRWANQGVFLLNSILTVERNQPLSHANKGWEDFTGLVLDLLVEDIEPKVFMLWGKKAQSTYDSIVKDRLDDSKHLILRASHPASQGYLNDADFLGCNHFAKANAFLKANHEFEIIW